MNVLRNCFTVLSVALFIFILTSCNEDDLIASRDVESFSSASFEHFDFNLVVEDFQFIEDGSPIVVGNGTDDNRFIPTPFVLRLDAQHQIEWLKFLELDDQYIYRPISITPSRNGGFTCLTTSDPDNQSEFNIDITRISSDGNITWEKRIAEEGKSLTTYSLVQLEDGDYIVFSELNEGELTSPNPLQLNRITEWGDTVWTKRIDDAQIKVSRQLVYFPEDRSIIGLSENGSVFGDGFVQLHKFDLDGNVIWQKKLISMAKVFSTNSNMIKVNGDQLLVTYTIAEAEVHLMKLDVEGNEEWAKIYTGGATAFAHDVIQTMDGNYVLLTNVSGFGNGGLDALLSKIDDNGEIVWEKSYGSASSDQGRSLAERDNGDLVVLGNTNEGSASESNFEMFLLETDEAGNPK